MSTVNEILAELESLGNESAKNVLVKHGAREPFFGVRAGDLKKIQKRLKKNYKLALDLYATGNSDAMYLAALIADEKQMTKADLELWVKQAYWYYLSEFAVPWVTSETPYAIELGLKWIESKEETIASAGWCTLSSYAGVRPDAEIDIPLYDKLLTRIENEIHGERNRVRHVMNAFVIAIGGFVEPLSQRALDVAAKNGKIEVNMGGTACKVPFAPDYIMKVVDSGRLGKKRKEARC